MKLDAINTRRTNVLDKRHHTAHNKGKEIRISPVYLTEYGTTYGGIGNGFI
jgi:hypothetical protein